MLNKLITSDNSHRDQPAATSFNKQQNSDSRLGSTILTVANKTKIKHNELMKTNETKDTMTTEDFKRGLLCMLEADDNPTPEKINLAERFAKLYAEADERTRQECVQLLNDGLLAIATAKYIEGK